jgi:hypothetical protein
MSKFTLFRPVALRCVLVDILQDSSILIVDAPVNLPEYINFLARAARSAYLLPRGACHNRRVMSKEGEIGHWQINVATMVAHWLH